MIHDEKRRRVLVRLAQAGLVVAASGLAGVLGVRSPGRWRRRTGARPLPDRRVPADRSRPPLVVARGGDPRSRVRVAVAALGGMERFVRPGQHVLLKPNMSWDRVPEQGANTNPEVVAEVVRLCREAGAVKVTVVDVPVHDPARSVERSGIGPACRAEGARVLVPPEAGFAAVELGGTVLDRWEVFRPALAADRIINVPVAKVHPLSRLTCGFKNWYGMLGGRRALLHQWIHPSIADLGAAFLPTLTVVDATRVMVRGGPQGGRPEDLLPVQAVAAGTDPVGLDAWAAGLIGADPRDVPYIALAQGKGLGSMAAGTGRVEVVRAGA